MAEEICLENKEGCKSSRAFESFRRRGIIEKPSRGDTVLTNSLILYEYPSNNQKQGIHIANEYKIEEVLKMI